jgi:hypothetical protein
MNRTRSLFIIVIIFTFSIFILSKSKPSNSMNNFYELKKTNNEVIVIIKDRDINKLLKYVHPKKGILFSPYSDIYVRSSVIIEKKELIKTYEKNEKLLWGVYDGTGERILLTFDEYFKRFIYDSDYINYEPNYDSIMGVGNTNENLNIIFPDSKVVEYYIPGTEKYAYMDWKSLRLVYEAYKGKYYLVAVVHNEWTI